MSFSLPACRHQPLHLLMFLTFTCIGAVLRQCFPMKTKNKTSIVGARTPPVVRSFGRLLLSGYGTYVSNWAIAQYHSNTKNDFVDGLERERRTVARRLHEQDNGIGERLVRLGNESMLRPSSRELGAAALDDTRIAA